MHSLLVSCINMMRGLLRAAMKGEMNLDLLSEGFHVQMKIISDLIETDSEIAILSNEIQERISEWEHQDIKLIKGDEAEWLQAKFDDYSRAVLTAKPSKFASILGSV